MFSKPMWLRLWRKLALISLAILAWLALPSSGLSQCGDIPSKSTCYACHEASYPVLGKGEWHEIHASKDCCWNCHGGNPQAEVKEFAHQGLLRQPLDDVYTDCYACHPFDCRERAERFARALNVAVVYREPPAVALPPALPDPSQQLVVQPTPSPDSTFSRIWQPEWYCLGLGFLFFFVWLLWNKRHVSALRL